jgi:hypothetical protein
MPHVSAKPAMMRAPNAAIALQSAKMEIVSAADISQTGFYYV